MTTRVTIDQLDLKAHNDYALSIFRREQFERELQVKQAANIPAHTHVVTTYITPSEVDILLGISPKQTPWAHFFAPTNFANIRRAPFTFANIVPTIEDADENSSVYQMIASIFCKNSDEEKEKARLLNLLKKISLLDKWRGFIVGRVGQFLRG